MNEIRDIVLRMPAAPELPGPLSVFITTALIFLFMVLMYYAFWQGRALWSLWCLRQLRKTLNKDIASVRTVSHQLAAVLKTGIKQLHLDSQRPPRRCTAQQRMDWAVFVQTLDRARFQVRLPAAADVQRLLRQASWWCYRD
ncbi:MAG: hypothetical protein BMS9Abin36_1666 [Gammaproteobacteria bacterium]|nr:MAG: hypothetical protein BMS9Abin36_1666 [Gammaproteobacteria bacterium]